MRYILRTNMYASFKSDPIRLLISIAAIAIVVAAFVARVIVAQRIEQQLAENDRLASALVPLKEKTREIDALRDLIAGFLAKKQVIEHIASRSSPAAEVLAELSRLPRTIVFTQVRIDDMRLLATGNASGESEVSEMITRLRASRFIRGAQTRKLDALPEHGDFGPHARVFEIAMDLQP
jgi:Tfp pilus assembly protein PilN